jgi:ribosomal protein L30/L7E
MALGKTPVWLLQNLRMSFRDRCPASKVFFLLAGLRTLMPLRRNSQSVLAVSTSGVLQMIKKVAANLRYQKIGNRTPVFLCQAPKTAPPPTPSLKKGGGIKHLAEYKNSR